MIFLIAVGMAWILGGIKVAGPFAIGYIVGRILSRIYFTRLLRRHQLLR